MNTKIRLLLADDSGEFRALLQKNLEEHPEIQVVGAAGDGEELVQLSSQLSPDIILTDTVLSKLDGLAAIRRITSASSGKISGVGLAQAKITGSAAMLFTISPVRQLGAEKPKNTSAPRTTSARAPCFFSGFVLAAKTA